MSLQYVYSLLRLLLIVGLTILSVLILYYLSTLTYPFIIAILIALFINPLVNFLERKAKLHRGLAVIIAIILLLCLIIGLVILLVAEIVTGTTYLARVIPGHLDLLAIYLESFFVEKIMPIYNQLTYLFSTLDTNQQNSIITNIQNIGEQITSSIGLFIKSFLENIPILIRWLPNAATVIIFSLLATFFISKDWYKFKGLLSNILPQKARSSGKTVFDELKKALFGFIRAQLTLISITTTIVLIGLLILRVDYAITIALLIGLVDILPYLGTGLVFVPWIIYLSFSGSLPLAIGLGILYLIVMIQRQVMEPKVLSSSIGLDPLATLISLFIGYQLIGFLGLIVGPVAVVILKTLHTAGVYEDLWQFIIGKERN
ncbi:sporulation integral membrane protein YtvI [Metabacillus niabensis]|uniref:Sporulation integral membrane protein YtvI n=1 Tax=Metabacillus niabensis TaxID=324854 RepID=A0ABT9YXB5_9BACI|nr:sporulation integral membrane protein YtvI [Metabacillus niabensis]MDQ0224622.1 sporulation integral membrane protein YtvI [Metabacillus niabensis]PAD68761.1 sporulation integral membrane protein YtvI [Bacillus sp. 7586-K]